MMDRVSKRRSQQQVKSRHVLCQRVDNTKLQVSSNVCVFSEFLIRSLETAAGVDCCRLACCATGTLLSTGWPVARNSNPTSFPGELESSSVFASAIPVCVELAPVLAMSLLVAANQVNRLARLRTTTVRGAVRHTGPAR